MTVPDPSSVNVPRSALLELADWWEKEYVTDDGWPLICANQLRDVVKKAAKKRARVPVSDEAEAVTDAEFATVPHLSQLDSYADARDIKKAVERIVATHVRKARVDELREAAKQVAELVPYGYGMNPDGTEDARASAYIEGHREAWQTLIARAARLAGKGDEND